jgi:hypothetical protein
MRTPTQAVVVSFFWIFCLPYMVVAADDDSSGFSVLQTLLNFGTVTCVVVWAFQCVAYIRYHKFAMAYESQMTGNLERFRHKPSATLLAMLQPLVAWAALAGCVLLLFVFNTAVLWNQEDIGLKFAGAFSSIIVIFNAWLFTKTARYHKEHKLPRFYVKLQTFEDFATRLLRLSDRVHPTDYPQTFVREHHSAAVREAKPSSSEVTSNTNDVCQQRTDVENADEISQNNKTPFNQDGDQTCEKPSNIRPSTLRLQLPDAAVLKSTGKSTIYNHKRRSSTSSQVSARSSTSANSDAPTVRSGSD